MKTSKPISTITYNSVDFLTDALTRLKYRGIITYFEFICHLPDTDDKKEHIHLYVEPNKVIDTEYLTNTYLLEDADTHSLLPLSFVERNGLKPLKPIAWRSSKFGDWYWYSIHDKGYLKSKMLTRNLYYSDADIVSSDFDTHRYLVQENPLSNYAFLGDDALRTYVIDCLANGVSLAHCLAEARIPIGKTNSVISFYNALSPTFHSSNLLKKEIEDEIQDDIPRDLFPYYVTSSALPFDDEIF